MKRSRGGAAGRRWRNRFVTLLYPAFVTLLYPVVLYQDEAITVTTSFLKSGGRQYPLAELSLFHRVEHSGWLRPRWVAIFMTFGLPMSFTKARPRL